MKHFISLCIFLILVCFSTQTPKYQNCPDDIVQNKRHNCECCKVTCSSNGKQMIAIACALSVCPEGTQIGYYDGDNTKVYPECCSHPICKVD